MFVYLLLCAGVSLYLYFVFTYSHLTSDPTLTTHLSPVVTTTPVLQRSAMASTKARAEKEREKQVQDKVQAILGAMLKDEDNK